MGKDAVILLNMGGPNNLDEVRVFLTNMFADKNILTVKSSLLRKFIGTMIVLTRTKAAQETYKQIGGKSPLVGHTKDLVSKLQNKLGEGVVVDFAMRYTPPFALEVIEKLKAKEIENIYLIPLYPQYSTTTTKSSLEDFQACYFQSGGQAIIHEIQHFFQSKTYNKALIQRVKEALDGADASEFELIYSAHGLPQKIVDNGDVYEQHVNSHVKILQENLDEAGIYFHTHHLAYQSKVGPMKWLEPSLEDTLHKVKTKKALILPLAFTIDNSETDYELSIEYKEIADELGFQEYRVAACPNGSEYFVEALEEIYNKMRWN